jgi:hypothetical protein
MPSFFLRCQG